MKFNNIKKFFKSPFVKGDVRRTGGLKAFSFIELIVVITIIAVLSVAAIISYGPVQKKSRDSRRVADLEKIRMALEMARQTGTIYPADLDYLVNNNFIQSKPTDPKLVLPYLYTRGATNYTYTLDALMEDPGSANCASCGSYNYRVANP